MSLNATWQVYYSNTTENIYKIFTVKTASKELAIKKAIEKIAKIFGINDRLLNHYNVRLKIGG